ncbi:MAG: T9SS type A sorting domain-containing protein [Bacteroidales bacterium]|nr:T9SS type A sorting domain-containing protein [Bacteroidales bacterium]
MKIKFICLLITLLFSSVIVFSQINHISWQQCFGTEERDDAYSIIHGEENSYYIGIQISSDGQNITNYHGITDAWIVNTDSIGSVIWERCYGGSEGDGVHKMIPVDNKTFYLLNHSFSSDGDVQNGRLGNFWIVKINDTGDIIWENSYGNRSCDPRDAILTPDGGLLMMGRIMYAGGDVSAWYGMNDIWLCKLDSIGNIEWEKTLGNQGQENASKIKLTSDNTVLMIGGYQENGGMINCNHMGTSEWTDIWIVELDLSGNIIRQLCYGGTYNDLGHDIIETHDGYVILGSTTSNDGDVSGFHGIPGDIHGVDIWVCKIDFYGNIIWQRCIGGSGYDFPIYITQTEDSGYIVMGHTGSNDGDVSGNHSLDFFYDIWVVKLNSIGEIEWQHCYGGERTEKFHGVHAVLKKSDYNFVLAAQSAYQSDDVECAPYGNWDIDAWILEIKDCSQYQPQTPTQPTGPDTLCYTTDSTSIYEINTAAGAWGYEWQIEPEEAGTILQDSLSAYITWNQQYEGEVAISARSYNDCGESDWSEEKLTWVYNCVGINEIKTGNVLLRVYPNPAKSSFEIRCSKFDIQKGVIEIYNTFGVKVKEIINPKGQIKAKVNTKGWAKGIYFVRVHSENGIYGSVKVLVN